MDKGDGNPILCITMMSDTEFATAGIKHFKTWTYTKGNLKGR